MKITRKYLRRIIKEEKALLLREQYPSPDGNLAAPALENDMTELLELIARAEDKAVEIESKMQDVEYGQHAGGREAEDLDAALENVRAAFGMEGL